MNSEFVAGWNKFCRGLDIDACLNETQRKGWAAAFVASEVETL